MKENIGETIEEIHVANCKKITDEAIEAILNNSKGLQFLMFHSCPNVTGKKSFKINKLLINYTMPLDASRVALEEYTFNKSNQKFKHLTWTVY